MQPIQKIQSSSNQLKSIHIDRCTVLEVSHWIDKNISIEYVIQSTRAGWWIADSCKELWSWNDLCQREQDKYLIYLSILISVASMPTSLVSIEMLFAPLTVNSVDGTDTDSSLGAATLTVLMQMTLSG